MKQLLSQLQESHLVAFALPTETGGLFDDLGAGVVLTGVGKINAAHKLTRILSRYAEDQMPIVINLGTAGSRRLKRGSVVCANRFLQFDMNVSPLGFKVGETPFDPAPAEMVNGIILPNMQTATCGSSDQFVTDNWPEMADIVDMEAYALAKVCHLMNAPFLCIKYITDGADEEAVTDWSSALESAARSLREVYDSINIHEYAPIY